MEELRVKCRLAWNNWDDTPLARAEIAKSEARDPVSAEAWNRVIHTIINSLPSELKL